MVDSQVIGGVTQGLGFALTEERLIDTRYGIVLNANLEEYKVPTAADVPPIELLHTEVPSPVTTFGVRGVGEVGTIPPGAAVANAICDALADFGVEITSLPLTAEGVWRSIRDARS
jgi:carbon-monoxide dehydrogenase large subunit